MSRLEGGPSTDSSISRSCLRSRSSYGAWRLVPAPAGVPVDRRVAMGLVRPFTVRPVSGVWARVDSRPLPPRARLPPFAAVFREPAGLADAFRLAAALVEAALRVVPRLDVLRLFADALVEALFAVVLRAGRFLAVFADFRAFAREVVVCFRADARPRLDAAFFAEPRF